MVTPVSISNYISLPDDFPVRNIAPQVKEVLKDFIDALSTIICDEEWRTSLNTNSATKKIWFVNKDPNLITAILDITDGELKEDLLQSLMDSLGSNKHVQPEVCICFLSLLAEQESPHFQDFFFIFRQYVIALSPIYESQ